MRRCLTIFSAVILILYLSAPAGFAAKQIDEGLMDEMLGDEEIAPAGEEALEEEEEDVVEEELSEREPAEEEEEEEEEEAEELEPEERRVERPPAARPRADVPPGEMAEDAREGEELRDVIIDGVISLNYIFDNSPDNFVLKYHLHLEGKIAASTAVIKGNARIVAEVKGFLAKWPTGECKLLVNVPETPFQMTFRKTGDDKANVNLTFPRPITETWESKCTFKDAPNAKFDTKGEPEKWLSKALQRARPPLARMTVNLSSNETTTMKFQIRKQTLKDPPLGSAEVEGTGVITVKPAAAE